MFGAVAEKESPQTYAKRKYKISTGILTKVFLSYFFNTTTKQLDSFV